MSNSKRKTHTTIHTFVESMLARTKKPYAEIAKLARDKFESETSPASVRHYASKMRHEGKQVPDRPHVREASFA